MMKRLFWALLVVGLMLPAAAADEPGTEPPPCGDCSGSEPAENETREPERPANETAEPEPSPRNGFAADADAGIQGAEAGLTAGSGKVSCSIVHVTVRPPQPQLNPLLGIASVNAWCLTNYLGL